MYNRINVRNIYSVDKRTIKVSKSKWSQEMPATKVVQKSMNMSEIRMKAKALGINPGKMNKADLIHAIQREEGYTPCFGMSDGQCPNNDCCFMKDCLKVRL